MLCIENLQFFWKHSTENSCFVPCFGWCDISKDFPIASNFIIIFYRIGELKKCLQLKHFKWIQL